MARREQRRGRREYNSWLSMKQRCYNTHAKEYPNYGGRGIYVCARWLHNFAAFIADMGPRPDGTSLDRKNNSGNYTPKNCRWATRAEQNANRRAYKKRMTHCPQGHPYSENNLRADKRGWRRCKICHRLRERARQQNKKRGG